MKTIKTLRWSLALPGNLCWLRKEVAMRVLTISGALLILLTLVGEAGLARQKDPALVTLKGRVVCSKCYLEAEAKGEPYGSEADIKCAGRCAKSGIPSALAVGGQGAVTLFILEKKKSNTDWVNYMGKEVEVSGFVRDADQKRYLKVYAIKSLPENISTQGTAIQPGDTSPGVDAPLPAEAPELTLKDLSGGDQKLSASRGKIVVLNFWATWCVPCRKEMPALSSIQNEYAAWGVQVIGAAGDELNAQPQVVKFIRDQRINFPIWLGATGDHMERFGLGKELPGTVIIDREGRIVARIRGMVKEEDLKRQLDSLVKRQTAALKEALKHPAGGGRSSNVPA